MSFNVKVANVLEALADHFDAVEAEKTSSVRTARQAQINELADKYAAATGDALSDDARSKLAESDDAIVSLVRSLTEKQAGVLEPLGGPSDRNDGNGAPLTKKEAAESADNRFLNWVNS